LKLSEGLFLCSTVTFEDSARSRNFSPSGEILEGAGGFSPPERVRIRRAFRPGYSLFLQNLKEIQLLNLSQEPILPALFAGKVKTIADGRRTRPFREKAAERAGHIAG
jgi:hypothetical protein